MSIQRITSGGRERYRVRVYVCRDDAGRRKYINRTYERRADAEREHAALDLRKGYGSAPGHKSTLSTVCANWLVWKRGKVRERTWRDYEDAASRYVDRAPEGIAPLGPVRLDRLTSVAVDDYYARLGQHIGPRTIKRLHTVLRQAIAREIAGDVTSRNVMDDVTPPKLHAVEKRCMTAAERQRFLSAAAADEYHALWSMMVEAGLTQPEVTALRWRDVDLSAKAVYVQHTMHWPKGGGWKMLPHARPNALRRVPLPPTAHAALLRPSSRAFPDAFVFSGVDGRPLGKTVISKRFLKLMEAAQLGERVGSVVRGKKASSRVRKFVALYRVKDLRTTAAIHMLKAGETPAVVSAILGDRDLQYTIKSYGPFVRSGAE